MNIAFMVGICPICMAFGDVNFAASISKAKRSVANSLIIIGIRPRLNGPRYRNMGLHTNDWLKLRSFGTGS